MMTSFISNVASEAIGGIICSFVLWLGATIMKHKNNRHSQSG